MFAARNAFMAGSKTPVSFVTQGAANTAYPPGVPAHQAGDLIIMWVGNWGGLPTKPTPGGTVPDWLDLSASSQGRLCYCFGTGSTTGGSWSNYGYHYAAVLRGATRIGAYTPSTNASGYATVPNITLQDPSGSSMILGVAATQTGQTWYNRAAPAGAAWNTTLNGISSTTGNFFLKAFNKYKATNGLGLGTGSDGPLSYGNPAIGWAVEACA